MHQFYVVTETIHQSNVNPEKVLLKTTQSPAIGLQKWHGNLILPWFWWSNVLRAWRLQNFLFRWFSRYSNARFWWHFHGDNALATSPPCLHDYIFGKEVVCAHVTCAVCWWKDRYWLQIYANIWQHWQTPECLYSSASWHQQSLASPFAICHPSDGLFLRRNIARL